MKKLLICIFAFALVSGSAHAEPMLTSTWMSSGSFNTWNALTATEKTESVRVMLSKGQVSRKPEDELFMITKIQACLDREVADPDYAGEPIPLYIPWGSCLSKYSAILNNRPKP